MKKLLLAMVFVLFLQGCFGWQKIPKPPTMTEQIVSAAKEKQMPLLASIMETKGLPVVFIGAIAGGVFCLIFLGKTNVGQRLGIALVGTGVTGLVTTATYQRHAETIANWSVVIVISAICIGATVLAVMFYAKYIKANRMFIETVKSVAPAIAKFKNNVGAEVVKAKLWATQSDDTVAAIDKIKNETA